MGVKLVLITATYTFDGVKRLLSNCLASLPNDSIVWKQLMLDVCTINRNIEISHAAKHVLCVKSYFINTNGKKMAVNIFRQHHNIIFKSNEVQKTWIKVAL